MRETLCLNINIFLISIMYKLYYVYILYIDYMSVCVYIHI